MYNPVDCIVPGASGSPDGFQYKPSRRMLLARGTLIDHESTRGAMRGAGYYIHPSDLADPNDYWFSALPHTNTLVSEQPYTAWVESMQPSSWVAHVGAVGKSALDRRVRDPAFEANKAARARDVVVVDDYQPRTRSPGQYP